MHVMRPFTLTDPYEFTSANFICKIFSLLLLLGSDYIAAVWSLNRSVYFSSGQAEHLWFVVASLLRSAPPLFTIGYYRYYCCSLFNLELLNRRLLASVEPCREDQRNNTGIRLGELFKCLTLSTPRRNTPIIRGRLTITKIQCTTSMIWLISTNLRVNHVTCIVTQMMICMRNTRK